MSSQERGSDGCGYPAACVSAGGSDFQAFNPSPASSAPTVTSACLAKAARASSRSEKQRVDGDTHFSQ